MNCHVMTLGYGAAEIQFIFSGGIAFHFLMKFGDLRWALLHLQLPVLDMVSYLGFAIANCVLLFPLVLSLQA